MQSTTNRKGHLMKTQLNRTATRLIVALAVTVPVALAAVDAASASMHWSDANLKRDVETLDGALAGLRGLTVA